MSSPDTSTIIPAGYLWLPFALTFVREAASPPWLLTVFAAFKRQLATVAVSTTTAVVEVPIRSAYEVPQILDLQALQCLIVIIHVCLVVLDGIRSNGVVYKDFARLHCGKEV